LANPLAGQGNPKSMGILRRLLHFHIFRPCPPALSVLPVAGLKKGNWLTMSGFQDIVLLFVTITKYKNRRIGTPFGVV
ncbi:MAG: hypothetical protein ACJAXQ_001384, partial [Parvibaculaceae bacterium]